MRKKLPGEYNHYMSGVNVFSVLIEYNARFYSPALGMFIQPDSIIPDITNSQAWNRYSYVLNSPLMYIDSDGHSPLLIFAFIGAVWAITSALQRAEVSTMEAAITSQQPEFKEEQTSIQQWSNNCMGQCHYAHAVNPAPYQNAGGPKPHTPLTDSFSTNLADTTTNLATAAGGFFTIYGMSLPKAPKLSDIEVRSQYLDDLSTIPESVDPYLSYKDQAYTAVELRTYYKNRAWNSMQDWEKALTLELNQHPSYSSFSSLVEKYQARGLVGDEIYMEIIIASQRSNREINAMFNLISHEPYLPIME